MNSISWVELPSKFVPYISFFEVYGELQFDRVILEKLDRLSKPELDTIRAFAKDFSPVEEELFGWIDKVGITNSRAAALCYFTSYFLELAKSRGLLSNLD